MPHLTSVQNFKTKELSLSQPLRVLKCPVETKDTKNISDEFAVNFLTSEWPLN